MKSKLTRDFYRPKNNGIKLQLPIGLDEKDCEAWTYYHIGKDNKMKFGAIVFVGKSIKPLLNRLYTDIESRDEEILKCYLFVYKKKQAKLKRKNATANDYFEVNDILVGTWGYEQTNVDFYQITEISKKTITLRQIQSKVVESPGFMTNKNVPLKNKFIGEPMRRIVNGYYVKISDSIFTKKWDNKPVTSTHYA